MMHGFGYGYGMYGWTGLIINLAIIIAIIWLIVWIVRRVTATNQGPAGTFGSVSGASPSPREILQIRYARGEITREQYLEALEDLNS